MTTVNHWGKWVDSETPITGVISNNNIAWEWAEEEICLTCEEAFEEIKNLKYCPDCGGELKGNGLFTCKECGGEIDARDAYDEIECDSAHTKIIGDWIFDTVAKHYDIDPNGEFAAIVNEIYTQVVFSKFTKKTKLCSPCYPGQGDLESEGEFTSYDLPEDLKYIRED